MFFAVSSIGCAAPLQRNPTVESSNFTIMIHKHLLTSIFLLICFLSSAQLKFKEGYIVNNRHERTDCLIRNAGNEESTMHFVYKLQGSKEEHKIELSKIEEFGIENELKCIRSMVSIDASRDRITNMRDTVREWQEGHAFLKVLVEGELASLYEYHDYGKPLYFYTLKGSNMIPLIYKKYHVEIAANFVEQILYDNSFREQLKEHLPCGSRNNSDRISYTKKDLVRYFENYYNCTNSAYSTYNTLIKKGVLLLKPAVSINRIEMGIHDPIDSAPKVYFDQANSIGFGIETAYIFPYNRYKWGIFAEANYLTYKTETIFVGEEMNPPLYTGYAIDYKSIEFPIGLTYYIHLDKNNRLFAKAAYVPYMILSESYIAFSESYRSNFSASSHLFFGLGYNYRNLALECKYYTPTNITQNIYKRGSDLHRIAFTISYAFRLLGDRGVR